MEGMSAEKILLFCEIGTDIFKYLHAIKQICSSKNISPLNKFFTTMLKCTYGGTASRSSEQQFLTRHLKDFTPEWDSTFSTPFRKISSSKIGLFTPTFSGYLEE